LEPNIPPATPEGAQLAQAQARADQLLDALRPLTSRLRPDADSALTFRPDPEQLEARRE
jgi:hypothetical protein